MLEVITFVLLQLATLTGATTTKVGSSGWGSDATNTSTTNSVGSSGWGSDVAPPSTSQTTTKVGSSGWGSDIK